MSRRAPVDTGFSETTPINVWSDAFAAVFQLFHLPQVKILTPWRRLSIAKKSPRHLRRLTPSTCG